MSLSGALSNATSGLNANALGTSIVSSNIANALNENYGRREMVVGSNATQSAGGVQVVGVLRHSDPLLAQQNRDARSMASNSGAMVQYAQAVEQAWGSVDARGGIADKLTGFEVALNNAATDPASETGLRLLSVAAEDLAQAFQKASNGIQSSRMEADGKIETMVNRINSDLQQLEQLNHQVVTTSHAGRDVSALIDQRDTILNGLADAIPLRVVERESGAIAVFSAGGKSLLDSRAVEFGFEPTQIILPHMRIDNGLLSELTIDGAVVNAGDAGMLGGGKLSAQFAIRDDLSVNAQRRTDAIARDVIERFGPGGPDSTLLAGDAGVFTDAGAAFLASDETGVSGRITLNTDLSSSSTDMWKWRDGLNAGTAGDVGNSGLLLSLRDEISTSRTPGSATLGTDPSTLVQHVERMSADLAANRLLSDRSNEVADTNLSRLAEAPNTASVNTDAELQQLISLEQNYAANARVVRVVDEMLQELLGI